MAKSILHRLEQFLKNIAIKYNKLSSSIGAYYVQSKHGARFVIIISSIMRFLETFSKIGAVAGVVLSTCMAFGVAITSMVWAAVITGLVFASLVDALFNASEISSKLKVSHKKLIDHSILKNNKEELEKEIIAEFDLNDALKDQAKTKNVTVDLVSLHQPKQKLSFVNHHLPKKSPEETSVFRGVINQINNIILNFSKILSWLAPLKKKVISFSKQYASAMAIIGGIFAGLEVMHEICVAEKGVIPLFQYFTGLYSSHGVLFCTGLGFVIATSLFIREFLIDETLKNLNEQNKKLETELKDDISILQKNLSIIKSHNEILKKDIQLKDHSARISNITRPTVRFLAEKLSFKNPLKKRLALHGAKPVFKRSFS